MENERAFFRLTNYENPIEILYKGKKYVGKIRDISGNGISFYILNDWEKGETMNVTFHLEDKKFSFDSKIIRKGDGTLGRNLYGCSFQRQTDKQQSELSARLFRIDGKRRKN